MNIKFLDCVSDNFLDNYFFLDGISEKLGFQRYTIIDTSAQSIYKVRSNNNDGSINLLNLFSTATKIISYISVILPIIVFIYKIVDRMSREYLNDQNESLSSLNENLNKQKTSCYGNDLLNESSSSLNENLNKQETFCYGNDWLKEDMLTYGNQFTSKDSCAYAVLMNKSQEKKSQDLNFLFPKREITAKTVHNLSVKDLLDLPSADYFAIVDLISKDQAIDIIKDEKADRTRKMALYNFNNKFAEGYGLQLRRITSLKIDDELQKLAQETLKNHTKFVKEKMQELQSGDKYPLLDKVRLQTSKSLKIESIEKNWKKLNDEYLPDGIPSQVTTDFLVKLNTDLRQVNHYSQYCEKNLPYGLRKHESAVVGIDIGLLPSIQVGDEIKYFCDWINKEIKECDEGKKNPIIVAAIALQLFISIHPFSDGNGRTGRLIADLILRRYGLLPAAWGDEKNTHEFTYFIHRPESSDPNNAVKAMIKAINESYKIIE